MLFSNDDTDDADDADDVDDNTDNADDAKANDDCRSRKGKGHVSALAPIEPSGSWCDAPPHH
jgi:hypothetical protein